MESDGHTSCVIQRRLTRRRWMANAARRYRCLSTNRFRILFTLWFLLNLSNCKQSRMQTSSAHHLIRERENYRWQFIIELPPDFLNKRPHGFVEGAVAAKFQAFVSSLPNCILNSHPQSTSSIHILNSHNSQSTPTIQILSWESQLEIRHSGNATGGIQRWISIFKFSNWNFHHGRRCLSWKMFGS